MLCILLPSQNCTKDASENKLPISSLSFVKKITSIYKRLFTLGSYLKTKDSYDRWVTRRLWGFRHQISKEKYLKMSVAHIGKLQENTMALCKMVAKLSG